MSGLKALEELRELCDTVKSSGFASVGCDAVLSLADEIEREHAQRIAELRGAVCERDGRIAAYERRNTELNDALKAICKRFGVSTEWSAEDAAKKVLEALERDYIAYPCDADGVRVEIGDKLHEHEDGHEFTADGLKIWGSDREWWAYQENGIQAPVSRCTHAKPRTLEDVLCDALANASCAGDGIRRNFEPDEPYVTGLADEIRAIFGEVDHG